VIHIPYTQCRHYSGKQELTVKARIHTLPESPTNPTENVENGGFR
jgi:hypothetical protein